MGPDSFVGTANLGQSPARSARRSKPVRRRKGSSERVDRIGSILPARETALRCGSPDVSRADQCDGLTARDARPRGLFPPRLDAQSHGQTPQYRIGVIARALAATAAVACDRLLPGVAGAVDRILRLVGYCGAARNSRRLETRRLGKG